MCFGKFNACCIGMCKPRFCKFIFLAYEQSRKHWNLDRSKSTDKYLLGYVYTWCKFSRYLYLFEYSLWNCCWMSITNRYGGGDSIQQSSNQFTSGYLALHHSIHVAQCRSCWNHQLSLEHRSNDV